MKIPPENIILRFLFYSVIGFIVVSLIALVKPGVVEYLVMALTPFWLGRTLYEIAKNEMKIIQQKA